jgi:isopentenyl diphosphate isomerase/L-lactate dehydrogenase-like FMN-dependent dehydrogenase
MPPLTAPCALNALAHPEGELAVARAVAAAGIPRVVSTLSSYLMEDVAAASGGKPWLQFYGFRDRAIMRELAERADVAGFAALCLTVDTPMLGFPERDARNHATLRRTFGRPI